MGSRVAAVLLMAVLRLGSDSCSTYTMKLKAVLITVLVALFLDLMLTAVFRR
jgi:hypothetical protein